MALRAAGFFAEQTVLAAPKSDQAQVALRGFYSTCAYAAIGLDFVLADLAFQSHEDRRAALITGVRYGNTNVREALMPVRTATVLLGSMPPTAAASQLKSNAVLTIRQVVFQQKSLRNTSHDCPLPMPFISLHESWSGMHLKSELAISTP
jgi:hypothetical protein